MTVVGVEVAYVGRCVPISEPQIVQTRVEGSVVGVDAPDGAGQWAVRIRHAPGCFEWTWWDLHGRMYARHCSNESRTVAVYVDAGTAQGLQALDQVTATSASRMAAHTRRHEGTLSLVLNHSR